MSSHLRHHWQEPIIIQLILLIRYRHNKQSVTETIGTMLYPIIINISHVIRSFKLPGKSVGDCVSFSHNFVKPVKCLSLLSLIVSLISGFPLEVLGSAIFGGRQSDMLLSPLSSTSFTFLCGWLWTLFTNP